MLLLPEILANRAVVPRKQGHDPPKGRQCRVPQHVRIGGSSCQEPCIFRESSNCDRLCGEGLTGLEIELRSASSPEHFGECRSDHGAYRLPRSVMIHYSSSNTDPV